MKNMIVANFQPKGIPLDRLKTYINAQIDNSLKFGWNRKDIILISNFEYSYNHVYAMEYELNKTCLTGSKMFAVQKFFEDYPLTSTEELIETIWLHDLDVWQNDEFNEIEISRQLIFMAICKYPTQRLAGGSIFIRKGAENTVKCICDIITLNNYNKEEKALFEVLNGDEFTKILDITYNVGSNNFDERYESAEKPVKAFHFHPERQLNKFKPYISDRLKATLEEHFGQ